MTIAQRFNVGGTMTKYPRVPKGRSISIPNISFVVGNVMLFEQREEFFLKR